MCLIREMFKISVKHDKIRKDNHHSNYSTNLILCKIAPHLSGDELAPPSPTVPIAAAGAGAVVRGLLEAVHFPVGETIGCSSMIGSFRFRFLDCSLRDRHIPALLHLPTAELDAHTDRSGH